MRTKDKKRTKEYIEQRRDHILKIARLVFSKKGFTNTKVEQIAKMAGLGKGTIYCYFKSKKELFFSIVDKGLDELRAEIVQRVKKAKDPLDRIESAIRAYLSFFERNRDFVGILIHEQSNFQKRIAERYFEHYYGNVENIKQTFKTGIEYGLIKRIDIDGAMDVLISMLNGLIYMWQIEGRKYRLTDKASIIVKIFFTGIVENRNRREKYESMIE